MVRWLLVLLLAVAAACSASSRSPASSGVTTSSRPAPPPTTAPATTGPAASASPSAPGEVTSSARPCLGVAPPAAYRHVVVIVMENRGLDQVNGSAAAPYVTGLGRRCGVATGYSGVAHPSLPNYIALTSGSTHGITDDSGPSAHPLAGPSIFSLLGTGWRSLEESMPSTCEHSTVGEYAVRHDPAAYYTGIASACRSQDVPMDDNAPDVSARYTFITPNVCNDGHDCSTATADRWLSVEVPRILDTAEYRSGSTVVFITWDENDAGGTRVPTYVVAPSVRPGTASPAPFSHYSLLRTTEELLGLHPLLGAAATSPSMRAAFHL